MQVCMTGVGKGEGVCGIGQFSILSPVMFADTVKVARVMAVGGVCLMIVNIMKSAPEYLGVRNLPVLFNVCSVACKRQMKRKPLACWLFR